MPVLEHSKRLVQIPTVKKLWIRYNLELKFLLWWIVCWKSGNGVAFSKLQLMLHALFGWLALCLNQKKRENNCKSRTQKTHHKSGGIETKFSNLIHRSKYSDCAELYAGKQQTQAKTIEKESDAVENRVKTVEKQVKTIEKRKRCVRNLFRTRNRSKTYNFGSNLLLIPLLESKFGCEVFSTPQFSPFLCLG